MKPGVVIVKLLLLTFPLMALAEAAKAPAASPASPLQNAVKLSAFDALSAVGQAAKLKALATQPNGTPIPNLELGFRVGGQEVGVRSTGNDGIAIFEFTVPDTLKQGSHAYEVRTKAFGAPNQLVQGQLSVVKAKTVITKLEFKQDPYSPLPEDGKNMLFVMGYLYRDGNQGIAGRNIKVKLGNKEKTIATGASGFFGPGIPLDAADLGKTLPLSIAFEGDDSYLAYVVPTTQHQIRPASDHVFYDFPTWPSNYDPEVRLGDKISVLVRMRNKGSQTPAKGIKVRLQARGLTTYTSLNDMGMGVTDASGQVTIHYTHNTSVPPGLYEMGIMYENAGAWVGGYTAKDPNHVNGNIAIRKTPQEIKVQAPASAHVGDTVTLNVQILRKTDHAPGNGFLRIYKGDTNEQLVGLNYPSSGGSHSFTVGSDMALGKQKFRVEALQPGDSGYESATHHIYIDILPRANAIKPQPNLQSTLQPAPLEKKAP